MTEASQTEDRNRPSIADDSPADDSTAGKDLNTLRRILVGPETLRLDRLEHRLDDAGERAREVSRTLPDAVVLSNATDGKLARALQPTLENAIEVSVRKNPKVLVDAIFPLMGPGIRKAIASTIMGMIQSFNQLLNHSFSIQGLKWRIEALRTRKPYAEILLLHTLVYQVEQVLLIHRESGLMLQHVVGPAVEIQDPDLVSGMLTAIEDFVRDSFGVTGDQSLDTLRIGNDRSVWIEQGPGAIIAAVIRGTPPLMLRNRMTEILNTIHLKFGRDLDAFDGDAVVFEDAREDLRSCLDTEFKASKRKTSPLLWILLIALLAVASVWVSAAVDRRRHLERFLADLEAQPGIVVTDVRERGERLVINGLKDPLAADPAMPSGPAGSLADRVDYRWQSYVSLEPEMVLQRATQLLDPPDAVSLSLDEGVLTAAGQADHGWIRRFRDLGTVPAGVQAVRWDRLVDTDMHALQLLRQRIESTRIYFPVRSSEIDPDQWPRLESLAADLREAVRLSTIVERMPAVQIVGYTDDSGSHKVNLVLSRRRADAVRRFLIDNGTVNVAMIAVGMGIHPMIKATSGETIPTESRFVACKLIDGLREDQENNR